MHITMFYVYCVSRGVLPRNIVFDHMLHIDNLLYYQMVGLIHNPKLAIQPKKYNLKNKFRKLFNQKIVVHTGGGKSPVTTLNHTNHTTILNIHTIIYFIFGRICVSNIIPYAHCNSSFIHIVHWRNLSCGEINLQT
jgi:hypothetical protein